MIDIIIESIGIGVIISLICSLFIKIILDKNKIIYKPTNDLIKIWNKYYLMEIGFFMTGMCISLLIKYLKHHI